MSKVHFFYGTVSSAKTAELLTKAHYMESINIKIKCFKPYDSRDGLTIKSRSGLERPAYDINWFFNEITKDKDTSIVFIDEVQFVNPELLKEIIFYCSRKNITIFAYGLKSNIKYELFPAIEVLLVHATHIVEIKAYCAHCGTRKAVYNVRLDKNGNIDNSGPVIAPGFNYEGRCLRCANLDN